MAEPEIPRTAAGTRILPAIKVIINDDKNKTRVMPVSSNNGTGSHMTRIMAVIPIIDCSLYSRGFCTKENPYRICPHTTFNKRLACLGCPERYESKP